MSVSVPSSATDPRIELASLISPLRFDVIVRLDFVTALGREIDAGRGELPVALELAATTGYATWFRTIAALRVPGATRSIETLESALRTRVRKTLELQTGFMRAGFDARHPVTIRISSQLETTTTGKVIAPRLLPHDGCHRLALLLWAGRTHIDPGEYLVLRSTSFRPPDNTATLLRHLDVDLATYLRFLTPGYLGRAITDLDAARSAMRELPEPTRTEALSVLAIDLPLVRQPQPPAPRDAVPVEQPSEPTALNADQT